MHNYKTWYVSRFASTPRFFWYSVAFAGVFLGTYAIWLFHQDLSQNNLIVSIVANATVSVGALVAFVISWIGAGRFSWKQRAASSPLERRLRFSVPLAFSVALLIQCAANASFTLYGVLGITSPPILAEILTLVMYPALLVGMLLLPRDALSGKLPLRFLMESVMIIVAIITFSWYFVLGPTVLQSEGADLLRNLLSIGFPVSDLLVISCLLLLSFSTVQRSLRRTMTMLSFGLVIFVATDSALSYQILQGHPTDWLSPGWIVGNFVLALSIQAMRWQTVSQATSDASASQASTLIATPMWRSLLSYALLPLVAGLVLYTWVTEKSSPLAIGVYVLSLLLLLVIFVKQVVAIRETHALNQDFQRLHHIIDEKNVALEEANAHLERLATTDPLTELPNHRALVAALDQEVARAQQYQRSCSLLFFDLDHFKALNDGYGHAGGDIALREFGTQLRSTLPVINTVGRWGGEEFIAILPEEDATGAASIAEGLRSVVAAHSFGVGGGMHLTCSIGIASFPAHGLRAEDLLQAADSAMYGAKRLGRNQVRAIDDPAVIALLAAHTAVEGRDEVTLLGTVQALALLVEKRDTQTGEHAQQVGELLLRLAQSLGLSEGEAQLLSLAGQVHDIGKIVIPDSILQKPDPLTEQDLACIHQHPQVGADVVSSIPSLRVLAPIICAHHEWWDGTGYPAHLVGEAIPFGARLLAVVDAYVVMCTRRRSQGPHGHQQALAELQRGAGTQFDPGVVASFLLMIASMDGRNEDSLRHPLLTL